MSIPVFLASDNNYAHFVATTIISACDHTEEQLDFYILDGGISSDSRQKIESLRQKYPNHTTTFLKIDLQQEFPDYQETSYISKAMYSRFLIPKLYPDFRKVLYIDVDLIFYGDIAQLYKEGLDGYVVGAVWESYGEKSDGKSPAKNQWRRENFGLSEKHHYFNSGVLMMDCVAWNEQAIPEKIKAISPEILKKLDCPDQDMLNIIFDCKYKELNERYNVINQLALRHTDDGTTVKDCVIRHFNDKKKPNAYRPFMLAKKGRYLGIPDYWKYLKQTPFFEEQAARFKGYFFLEKLFGKG